ncbi:homoserine dehydrogenase [Candidatus Magnetaquicoccus inordinatus]|uniref:homoserine dehydrogenase n=1 Tax=Candidatus Magnetaquicoccus inordinatus TaxID=2496818 RepID=UPI00102AA473|nr:homoserine dehydrogenase [Candidatus Magnetaquicoccus inordinatus]
MQELRVGILGFGVVGRGVVDLLLTQGELLRQRTGMAIRLRRIATRTPGRDRGLSLGDIELTDDLQRVVAADDIDVVVELMGGLQPARSAIEEALQSGKDVVTANKALLATYGHELVPLALAQHRELLFEAAVAGAIPIIKVLRESLAANRIDQLYGILNGTCNYILTEMREQGSSFADVLRDAQAKGFAEADPSFDIDGIDAAHKLAILAAISFGTFPALSQIHIEGIRHVADIDIQWATEMGYRIKLLGIAKQDAGGVELRIQPTLVPVGSMVASVEGVHNAVFVRGHAAGTTMYYGRGAGEAPTASAVVGDLVEIARSRRAGCSGRVAPFSVMPEYIKRFPVRETDEWRGEYYLRLAVADRPGVLAEVTQVLAKQQISIDAIHQKGRSAVLAVPLIMVTHATTERQIRLALAEMEQLDAVQETPRFIRIEPNVA